MPPGAATHGNRCQTVAGRTHPWRVTRQRRRHFRRGVLVTPAARIPRPPTTQPRQPPLPSRPGAGCRAGFPKSGAAARPASPRHLRLPPPLSARPSPRLSILAAARPGRQSPHRTTSLLLEPQKDPPMAHSILDSPQPRYTYKAERSYWLHDFSFAKRAYAAAVLNAVE